MSRPSPELDQEVLKDHLARALDLPQSERETYCSAVLADDPVMGKRLRVLVAATDEVDTFLDVSTWADHPGASTAPSTDRDPGHEMAGLLGTVVGRYTIEALLGTGAFGFVFRASQQQPVRRAVAMKVLRSAAVGGEFIHRFELERQALARLTHPAISRIYDAGELPDGRPFFVMELVDGAPITEYCDRAKLSLSKRLELFVAVCQAVQHAHAKGIIHRDLKPSNVMVEDLDGGPRVKIIDFGIAKATDAPLTESAVQTLAMQVMGTPLYMSPEQASFDTNEIDTRTDVYSLGILLFELMCGSTPMSRESLRHAGIAGLAAMLRDTPPPLLSVRAAESSGETLAASRSTTRARLKRELAGPIDWVTRKAIEPCAKDRYPTVYALECEVRRILTHQAVEVRPPGISYQARVLARRHPVIMMGGGVALSALALILIVMALGLVLVNSARNEALAASKQERIAREDAELVLTHFLDVFGAASGDVLGRDATVLEAARSAASAIDQRFGHRPVLAARLHHKAGNLFRTLGDLENAQIHLGRSVDGLSRVSPPVLEMLYEAQNDLALLAWDQGDIAEFTRLLEDVLRRCRRDLGTDHRVTLLVASNLAGNAWVLNGEHQRAINALRPVVHEGSNADFETRISAMGNLALAYSYSGNTEEAEPLFRRVLELESGNQSSRHRLAALNNLASMYTRQDRHEDALPVYQEVLAILDAKYGPNTINAVVSLNNIASSLTFASRYDDALDVRDEAERRAALALPQGHPAFARLANSRGLLYQRMGRFDEAEALLLQAHRSLSELPGVPQELVRSSAADVHQFYEQVGPPEEASRWAELAQPPK